MTLHELKIHPEPFRAIQDLTKTFEFRKADRDFKVGDTLILREYHPLMAYTGEYALRKVIYILREGFCLACLERSTRITEKCRGNPAVSA